MRSRIQNPEFRSQNEKAEAAVTDFCLSVLLDSGFWILNSAFIVTCALAGVMAQAQTKPTSSPTPVPQRPSTQTAGQPPRQVVFDLSEAGVQIKPEPRLIVVMAALDAASFDPTPAGEAPSDFRMQLHRDQASLDPDLRQRLKSFYEHHKLLDAKGKELPPAEQAARYVSLAYAISPAPTFEEPPRSDDLPGGLLDVLDFAPLVREFYRKSGIDARLPTYIKLYQAEGDRLRNSTIGMVRSALSYLNTRPITTTIERIPVTSPDPAGNRKKNAPQTFTTREHERRFFIVPDLLAAPGAINFRVIADDYFVTVPDCNEAKYICAGRDTNAASPELRRAYLNYVIDPLVVRFSREITARREQIKQLLDARKAAGAQTSPDIFLTVARSLTTAADARLEETARLNALSRDTRAQLDKTTDAAKRAEIVKELDAARSAVSDEAMAQLAEGYESGAVLDFYFAEQLRGVESSGFDISNSLADMIASFDPARETRRLEEADAARKRALAARKAREAQAETAAAAASLPNAALVQQLLEVDGLMQKNNYAAAEERLLALVRQFPEEPRVFFALGKVASRSARDATDEDVQSARLNKALVNYRNAVSRATPDTDRCLIASAHEAMGSILKFLERKDEALKEFDAAIGINDPSCEAYSKAIEEKKTLLQPK
jgi:tetratricopeptide (TPR) repeat protein